MPNQLNEPQTETADGYQPCGTCQSPIQKPNESCDRHTGSNFCDACCKRSCPYYAQCYLQSQKQPRTKGEVASARPDSIQKEHFLSLLKREPWGAELTLNRSKKEILNKNDPVIFDHLENQYGNNFIYDAATGQFTILEPATFVLTWQLAIEGTYKKPFARFAIKLNETIARTTAVPQTSGQIIGQSLITTTLPNTTVYLFNDSGDDVLLSRCGPIGNLLIHSL